MWPGTHPTNEIPCKICNNLFTPRSNIKNPQCCENPDCRKAAKKEWMAEYLKKKGKAPTGKPRGLKKGQKKINNTPVGYIEVNAKCPNCERIYTASIAVPWTGNGLMRKLCTICKKNINAKEKK